MSEVINKLFSELRCLECSNELEDYILNKEVNTSQPPEKIYLLKCKNKKCGATFKPDIQLLKAICNVTIVNSVKHI